MEVDQSSQEVDGSSEEVDRSSEEVDRSSEEVDRSFIISLYLLIQEDGVDGLKEFVYLFPKATNHR